MDELQETAKAARALEGLTSRTKIRRASEEHRHSQCQSCSVVGVKKEIKVEGS